MAGHVTVVGAGVVGVCAGLALLRDGHDVTVLDRDGPGENCSFGNAGMICDVSASLPLPSPAVLRDLPRMLLDRSGPFALRWRHLPRLLPWLLAFAAAARPARRLAGARALHALLADAPAAWDALVRGSAGEELIRRRGLLTVYESDRGWAGDAPARALLRGLGCETVALEAGELRQMEPALAPAVRHAAFHPGCYSTVDPYRLTLALAERFVAEGGTIERARVAAVEAGAGRIDALETAAGRRPVDRLVIAAGAWSQRLAATMGLKLPLVAERGYHSVLHGVHSGLRRPLIHGEGRFGINAMNEGLRLAGTVELASHEAAPDWRRADIVFRRARAVLRDIDAGRAAKVTRWMGRRPTLPDYLPVLGPVPGAGNAWFDCGHQHLGLTLAARSGQAVAALVAGRDPGLDLAPFRAGRFAAGR